MRVADPYLRSEIVFRRRFLLVTLAAAVALATIMLTWPEIDLSASEVVRLCAEAPVAAPWCLADPTVETARNVFRVFTLLAAIAVVLGGARTVWRKGGLGGLAQMRWLYLASAFAVGPGLVANVILKDNWGRARPRQVVEFGGTQTFTPPLVLSDQCRRNCSFVSGEASAVYIPFFAVAQLVPQARVALIAGGIVAGGAAGAVRMAQGAHFLSDVLFAGLFMALTASLLHVAMIGLWRDHGLAHYIRRARVAYSAAMRRAGLRSRPSVRLARSRKTSIGISSPSAS